MMCQQHACNQYLQLSKYARRLVCQDKWHRVVFRMCKMYDICHNCQLKRPITRLFIVSWARKLEAHFNHLMWKDVSDGCEPNASNRYRDKLVMNRIDSRMTRQIFNFHHFWHRMGYQSIRICEYVNCECAVLVSRVFSPLKMHIIPFNFTEFWAEALYLSIFAQ